MKLNKTSKALERQNAWHKGKHAKLYVLTYWNTSGKPGFYTEGTLIPASAVPHCKSA